MLKRNDVSPYGRCVVSTCGWSQLWQRTQRARLSVHFLGFWASERWRTPPILHSNDVLMLVDAFAEPSNFLDGVPAACTADDKAILPFP